MNVREKIFFKENFMFPQNASFDFSVNLHQESFIHLSYLQMNDYMNES